MCIIVAKPVNVKMPNMDILESCFINNPDGAGIMFNHNKMVYGYKGFMTFEEFEAALSKLQEQYGNFDEKGVVMHFRITTHGGSNQQNTHPFPLMGGYRAMRKRHWVASQGFAHNGIISETSRHEDVKKFGVSDTMVFGKIFALPVSRWTNIAEDIDAMQMLGTIAGSKLAFMNGKGHISTFGDFNEDEGILYSNYTWLDYGRNPYYDYKTKSYKMHNRTTPTSKTLRRLDARCIVYGDKKHFDGKYAEVDDAFCVENGTVYTYSSSLKKWIEKYCDVDFLFDIDEQKVKFVSQRYSDEIEKMLADDDRRLMLTDGKKASKCN